MSVVLKNAILNRNASMCFRLEDATMKQPKMYFLGDETMDLLKDAKERGVLFARKFRSDDPQSMVLLQDIQNEMHGGTHGDEDDLEDDELREADR